MENKANPTPSMGRKRKKRSASSSSTSNPKIKYGCPKDFERVSQYMCLHYHSNTEGIGISSTFAKAKAYCKTKGKRSSVLYLENAADALQVWKWLGKYTN